MPGQSTEIILLHVQIAASSWHFAAQNLTDGQTLGPSFCVHVRAGCVGSNFRETFASRMQGVPKGYHMVFVGGCHNIWRAPGESM